MKRPDVVLVEVPYLAGGQSKRRPALVLQDDAYNQSLIHTIIAAISSRIGAPIPPTHCLLDPATPDGKRSGVHFRSVVRYDRIFTIDQRDISTVIGSLSNQTMRKVDDCLRKALGL
jgi:mRNA-degrading endonuclease toxin of MazEF toxin-antitoxin module